MQISVENTGNLGRRMTVAVPADELETEIKKRLQNLAKKAKLPGFRPGKVPLKVIEGQYGVQVLHEVAGNMIESSLQEAFSQEKLVPAGSPDVEPRTIERGKDLEYVANFDIFPQVESMDIVGVEIERPQCEIVDTDVDRTLESMRKQKTTFAPIDRGARNDDQIVIDFEGKIDGEVFAGGQAQDYKLVLGQGQFMPDFEKALEGAKAGESRTAKVEFPQDYQSQDVAGKEAEFEIQLKEVAEPRLPEIDETFAREFGVEDGDLDKLKQEIRENLSRERDERISRLTRKRVMDALIEKNDFEVPPKLTEREIDNIIASNKAMLEQQGIPADKINPDREQLAPDAERRVALGLILSEVVQSNNILPDDARVKQRVENMAASYEDPKAFIQWYHSSPERVRQIENVVLEEQVVEHLLEGANVKDVTISLEELIAEAV